MRSWIRTTLLAALLLACASSVAGAQIIGIRIGPPPRPRVVRVLPPRPGPEYAWVDGYWYPVGSRYRWHEGYWTRPPYAGARWIVPRYEGERYHNGYWEGPRGRFEHDHRWDRDRRHRDFDRDHDRDHDRDRDRH